MVVFFPYNIILLSINMQCVARPSRSLGQRNYKISVRLNGCAMWHNMFGWDVGVIFSRRVNTCSNSRFHGVKWVRCRDHFLDKHNFPSLGRHVAIYAISMADHLLSFLYAPYRYPRTHTHIYIYIYIYIYKCDLNIKWKTTITTSGETVSSKKA